MKRPLAILLLIAPVTTARSAEFPSWAYPPVPQHEPSPGPALLSVPGSDREYTQGQIDSGYEVADWFPNEHPPMPHVVANGDPPSVRACGMCHLPNGEGHPESAGLTGLPVAYTITQMQAFLSGARTGPRAASMAPIATGVSEEGLRASAEYFAQLTPVVWTRIKESETAPTTRLGFGGVRYRAEDGGNEPLGERIISLPENDELGERRDGHSGFVEFVPPGSIARGKELVDRPMSGISCATCHGATLGGQGEIPRISGQFALQTFRALNDILLGYRTTPGALAMKASIPKLDEAEMIAVAAYLGSLPPK